MSARPIVFFPDPRLRQPCTPVLRFDADLRALVRDLEDSMRRAAGVGIAGPHIGVLQRVAVIDLGDGARSWINPAITWRAPTLARHEEGSISMPGVSETIERPSAVRLSYQDVDGQERTQEADGFLAICLQHEIDQLDGIFWLDRLSKLKRDRLVKKYEKRSKLRS